MTGFPIYRKSSSLRRYDMSSFSNESLPALQPSPSSQLLSSPQYSSLARVHHHHHQLHASLLDGYVWWLVPSLPNNLSNAFADTALWCSIEWDPPFNVVIADLQMIQTEQWTNHIANKTVYKLCILLGNLFCSFIWSRNDSFHVSWGTNTIQALKYLCINEW